MKLVALMPVRNEEWILRLSAEVALSWCDAIVLLDHASTDDTPAIVADLATKYGDRVVRLYVDGSWAEMLHRQLMLEAGRAVGGTHFALVDADEIVSANLRPHLRQEIGELRPGQCLDVPMLPVWRDLEHVRSDDCVWTRAMLTVGFCDAPGLHWKTLPDGYTHHHRAPFGETDGRLFTAKGDGVGGVMHLQFADWPRLRAKHALYKMREAILWPDRYKPHVLDAIYSQALNEDGLERRPCPAEWWAGYDKTQITLGGVPWQRTEAKRLLAEHGAKTFAGLELWNEAGT